MCRGLNIELDHCDSVLSKGGLKSLNPCFCHELPSPQPTASTMGMAPRTYPAPLWVSLEKETKNRENCHSSLRACFSKVHRLGTHMLWRASLSWTRGRNRLQGKRSESKPVPQSFSALSQTPPSPLWPTCLLDPVPPLLLVRDVGEKLVFPPAHLCLSLPAPSAFLKGRKKGSRGQCVCSSACLPRSIPARPPGKMAPQQWPSPPRHRGCLHQLSPGRSQFQEGSPLTAWYLGTSAASERSAVPASQGEPEGAAGPPESRGELSSRESFRAKAHLEETPFITKY